MEWSWPQKLKHQTVVTLKTENILQIHKIKIQLLSCNFNTTILQLNIFYLKVPKLQTGTTTFIDLRLIDSGSERVKLPQKFSATRYIHVHIRLVYMLRFVGPIWPDLIKKMTERTKTSPIIIL